MAAVQLGRGAPGGRRADAAVLHRPPTGPADDRATRHRHPQRGAVLAFRRAAAAGYGGGDFLVPGAGMTRGPHIGGTHPQPRAVSAEDRVLPEGRASLWQLVAGPTAWALHFLACYATAAVWCAKHTRLPPSAGLRGTLWLYTAIALAAIDRKSTRLHSSH